VAVLTHTFQFTSISVYLIQTFILKAGLGHKTQQLAINLKGIGEFWCKFTIPVSLKLLNSYVK